jgi:hypothetical protein
LLHLALQHGVAGLAFADARVDLSNARLASKRRALALGGIVRADPLGDGSPALKD